MVSVPPETTTTYGKKTTPYDKKKMDKAYGCCPKPPAGSVTLDEAKYNELLHTAIAKDAGKPPDCEEGEICCKTYTERIVVPKMTEVRVPIEREVMKPGYKKTCVKGTRLVPKQKWRTVDEKHIEVKEEVCRGTRTVWKPFEEEYCEVIKKPVEVIKTRYVPYTEFCEEEVDVEVEVPCDRVQLECGHRIDKKLTSQVVEVEKQEYFKLVPTRIERPVAYHQRIVGPIKDLGVMEVGKDMYDEEQCAYVPAKPATGYQAPVYDETAYGMPAEEIDGDAPPAPVELEYKHIDAASFTSSSRPATREQRRVLTGHGNRPVSRGGISQLGELPQRPVSRQGSFDRPVSRSAHRDRPPTGALFQGPNGQVMMQPSYGQQGRMHASLEGLMAPQQARLKTPYTQGAPAARPPSSQRGSQRMVVDARPISAGSGSRLGRTFGNGHF